MKSAPPFLSPAIAILLVILFLNYSCGKDSDLFYESVLPEPEIVEEDSNDEESSEESDTGDEENSEESDSNDEESSESEEDPNNEESSESEEDSNNEENPEESDSGDESDTNDDSNSSNDKGNGSIIWHTDFETVQWSKSGDPDNNEWEVDGNNEIRTTSDSRTGNQAIRLGAFNGDKRRNEINVDDLLGWEEHWIGFSIKITEETQKARTYLQLRNLRESGGVGEGVINPVTLRQGDPGQLYFQTSTVAKNVDNVYEDGASTGTSRTNLNYEKNEYNDFVIHWVLDPEDGYLEIWHNGVKIIDKRGTTTYRYAHVDGEPYSGVVFPKIGVYWSPNNPPQGEALYDSFKVWKGSGGRYEDVSPGGLSPR